MLDWSDVQFFLAIQRAATLAGAARALKVEHTTVGRRLVSMERALGGKLFMRTPDGLRLTAMAEQIVPLAEQAEAAMLQIERVALADDARVEGSVRVTTSETFAPLLGRWLAELKGKHSGITVELLAGNARLDLSRREADIAVRFAATSEGRLLCRRIATTGWAVYASRPYVEAHGPLPPSGELRGHDVIGFNESLAEVPGAQWIAKHGQGANIVMHTGSIPAAQNAALAGLGVAVIPCFLGDPEPALVRLLPGVVGARDSFLVVHPDLARVARVRVVLNFLVERFVANAALLSGVPTAEPRGRSTKSKRASKD